MSLPTIPPTSSTNGPASPLVNVPNPLSSQDVEWIGEIPATSQVGSPPFRLNITPEELERRYALLEAEMNKWMADESGHDERTWPVLKAGLIANRGPEERCLFSD